MHTDNAEDMPAPVPALMQSGMLKRRDSGFLSRLPSTGPQVPLHRQNSEKQIPSSSSGSGARSSQSHHSSSFSNSAPKPILLEPTPQKLLKMNHNPYTPPTTHDSTAAPSVLTTTGMSVPAGVVVARYLADFQTETTIGKGSFGRVDLARHRVDGWSYAIKRMKYRPSHNKEALDTVLNEIFMLASLSHPHIVRYHSSWIEEGTGAGEEREVFIQTEFCYGGSLGKWWPQWLSSAGIDTVLASAARHKQQVLQQQQQAAGNGKHGKSNLPRPSPGPAFLSSGTSQSEPALTSNGRPHPTLTPRPTPKNGLSGYTRPTPTQSRSHPGMGQHGSGGYHPTSGSIAATFGFGPQTPDEATVASAVLKVEAKLCEILRHVCKALVYLHDEKHVVHLDMKPDNIFVQQETLNLETATFKIGDCGSMRKIPSTGGTDSLNSSIGEKMDSGVSLSPRGLPINDLVMEASVSAMDTNDMDVAMPMRPRAGMTTPPPPLRHTPTPPAPSVGSISHATPTSLFPTFTSSNVPATPLVKGGKRLESIASVPTTPLLPTSSSKGSATVGSKPSHFNGATTPSFGDNSGSWTPVILTPQNGPSATNNTASLGANNNSTANAPTIDGDDIDGDGRYLAPELLEFTVLLNDQLPKADMYALGCSIVELAEAALHGDTERLSAPFKQLLSYLLSPSPQSRPSAAQVLTLDLLQPPEVLHLRRELRRLEEKVFELERQRSTPRYGSGDWQSQLSAQQGSFTTPRDDTSSMETSATHGKFEGFNAPFGGQHASNAWSNMTQQGGADMQHDQEPQHQQASADTQTTPGRHGLPGYAPITPTSSATSSPGYTSPTFALKSSTAMPRFGAGQPATPLLQNSADGWKHPASSGFSSTPSRVQWRMESENAYN